MPHYIKTARPVCFLLYLANRQFFRNAFYCIALKMYYQNVIVGNIIDEKIVNRLIRFAYKLYE